MTEVVFTQNAGRFRKNQVVNFQPALADFFVSKIRCASFIEKPVVAEEKPASPDDFSDILMAPAKPKKIQQTAKKKYTRSAGSYATRDLQAED